MFRKKEIIVERERIENVNFTNKKNSIEGVLSFGIGIASIVVFIVLSVISTIMDGKGTVWIGVAGCLAGVGNVIALFLSIKALKKEDVYYRMPTIGAVMNGIAVMGYLFLYVWGLLL